MRLRSLGAGLVSFIPGGNDYLTSRFKDKQFGSSLGRYCYAVWLRHLVLAHQSALTSKVPAVVAELGPGRSIGAGLAALLSGATKYHALDAVDFSLPERNLAVLDELVVLFQQRAPIPDHNEFPQIHTVCDSWDFPSHILGDALLDETLAPERVQAIKQNIVNLQGSQRESQYITITAPWCDHNVIQPTSVDMVFSMSVLEHVDDLAGLYQSLRTWIKPSGFISHEIDFRAHGHAAPWNGHWAISDFSWWLIRGKRPYLINRLPHSAHTELVTKAGFHLIVNTPFQRAHGIARHQLSKRFRTLSDDDLSTYSAFIQAQPRELENIDHKPVHLEPRQLTT